MKTRCVIALELLSCFAAALTDAPAWPAETSAEALIAEGLRLRRAGDNLGALPKFERAHALMRAPRSAAQLGLCLQAVGNWVESERFLAEAVAAEGDAWVEKNREVLMDSLRLVRDHVGFVEVRGEPEGSEVWVNGERRGTLPLSEPLRLNEGKVFLELRSAGLTPAGQEIAVVANRKVETFLRLADTSLPATAALPGTTLPTARNDQASHGETSMSVATGDGPDDNRAAPTWRRPWVLGIVGAVVVAASVGFLLTRTAGTAGVNCPECAFDTVAVK